ncbi:hypothetical protein L3X38_003576 [Prunus dulcis]|uniref:Uncharacterized protein n=1 Tax=Prunus dulcis TaxID=3755 RepID=A0AAD4ZMB7_PRUDU|nr:hypothetical protein L3X38_003576 [Prunus dulcis]
MVINIIYNIKKRQYSKVLGNVINAASGKGIGIFYFSNKYNSGDAKAGGGGKLGGLIVEGNMINADKGDGGIDKFHIVYYNLKSTKETSRISKGEASGSSTTRKMPICNKYL